MVGRNFLEHPEIGEFEILAPRSNDLNLCDFTAVQNYIGEHRPEMLLHLAGKVGGIQANLCEPVGFLMENLDMGRNLIWAARQAGIKRLINVGSSCMYPRNHEEPLSEELILKGELEPTNEGYALAKVVVAKLCEYITREDSTFEYKTIIPCNLYGRYDKFNPEYSHLVPAIIHKLHQAKLNGDKSVVIWGDGTARREFMYAGDVADALVNTIKNFDSLPGIMNLGLGQDYTVNEYYKVAAMVIGYNGSFEHDLNRPVGMARKLVDIEKQKAWRWIAPTALEDGINKTYQYYLAEKEKYDVQVSISYGNLGR